MKISRYFVLLFFIFFSLKSYNPILFVYGPTQSSLFDYKYDREKIQKIYDKFNLEIKEKNTVLLNEDEENCEKNYLLLFLMLNTKFEDDETKLINKVMDENDIRLCYRENIRDFRERLIEDIENIDKNINEKITIVTVGLGAKVISDIFEEINEYIKSVVSIDLVENLNYSPIAGACKSRIIKKEFSVVSYDEDGNIKYDENDRPELTPIKTNKLKNIPEKEDDDESYSSDSSSKSELLSSDTSKKSSTQSYSSSSKNIENKGQKIIIEDKRVPMILITLEDAEKFLKYQHKDDVECTCFGINWTKKKIDRTIALVGLAFEIITAFA
ncbi:Atg1 family protein [Candidatus Dependentiae bacterium]|nr:Atg1 family protein [Candidatus Dependentiae bacterium]MBU4386903.1 Atg1 family protein [Candidatus Dependentiae bacterium]MCG2756379.1 Atg1 family protein [Candidatus Dependentiae bacterium]